MKISIQQSLLLSSLEKGACAALSDISQNDSSNFSALLKSVKITAGENLVIESGNAMFSVKYSIPVGDKDSGIIVQENGSILVPAKEIMEWTKKQSKNSVIGIGLNLYKTPQVLTAADGSIDDGFVIKKIGEIKAVCKGSTNSKSVSKWSLDCYDPEHISPIDFSNKPPKQFDIKSTSFSKALKTISFAALPKDYEHVLDSISIQKNKDDLYFASTDTKRCAIYKLQDVSNIGLEKSILIPASLLEQLSKISKEENILEFYYSEKSNHVFVSQKNLDIRMASIEENLSQKFPNISMLLDKKYEPLTTIEKTEFLRLLDNAALVNNFSALFSFKNDNGAGECTVKAISDNGKYNEITYSIKTNEVKKEVQAVWGVMHLMEVSKSLGENMISMEIPENLKSVKITGVENNNFSYYCMIINNPKYNSPSV